MKKMIILSIAALTFVALLPQSTNAQARLTPHNLRRLSIQSLHPLQEERPDLDVQMTLRMFTRGIRTVGPANVGARGKSRAHELRKVIGKPEFHEPQISISPDTLKSSRDKISRYGRTRENIKGRLAIIMRLRDMQLGL